MERFVASLYDNGTLPVKPQEAWPDDAVERACLAYEAEVDGDVHSPNVPRDAMRAALTAAAHPATTHCDNCGCDWLDNGLNPVGCPYCKLTAAAPQQPPPVGVTDAMVERACKAFRAWQPIGASVARSNMRRALEAVMSFPHQQPAPSVSEKPVREPTKVHVTWERLGNCLWHSNCPNRGMFRIDREEVNRTLLHCVACGVNAWAPHGIHDKQTVAVPAEPIPTSPSVEAAASEVEYQFEVWQDDAMEASGSASTPEEAQREAGHYALMYGQDGPVEVRFYERRPFAQQPASGEDRIIPDADGR